MLRIDEIGALVDRLTAKHPHDRDVLAMCAEAMRLALASKPSIEAQAPWMEAGCSRATWYRDRRRA